MATDADNAAFYFDPAGKFARSPENTEFSAFSSVGQRQSIGFIRPRRPRQKTGSFIFSFPLKEESRTVQQMLESWEQKNESDTEENPLLNIGEPLENSWKNLVRNFEELNDRQNGQQEAIWELITTEYRHIKNLEAIRGVFISAFNFLKAKKSLFESIDPTKIFGDINLLHKQTCILWNTTIRPMLDRSRKFGAPFDLSYLGDGFLNVAEVLFAYREYCQYCRIRTACLKKNTEDNEQFRNFVEWCEGHEACNRLELVDWLMKPVQRITKYGILFEAILKKTDSPEHRNAINRILESIDDFLLKINSELRTRDEEEKLVAVYDRIVAFDCFDTMNDEISRVLCDYPSWSSVRQNEQMTQSKKFIQEFPVKIKNVDSIRKTDGFILVFSDMVLFCRRTGRKRSVHCQLKVFQPIMELDRIRLHDLRETGACLWIVTGSMGTVDKAYIINCTSPVQQASLFDTINKAQEGVVLPKTKPVILDVRGEFSTCPGPKEIGGTVVEDPINTPDVPKATSDTLSSPNTTPRNRVHKVRRCQSFHSQNDLRKNYPRIKFSEFPVSSKTMASTDTPKKFPVFRRLSDGDVPLPKTVEILSQRPPRLPRTPPPGYLFHTDSVRDLQKKRGNLSRRRVKTLKDHKRFLSDIINNEHSPAKIDLPRRESWAPGDKNDIVSDISAYDSRNNSSSLQKEFLLTRVDSGVESNDNCQSPVGMDLFNSQHQDELESGILTLEGADEFSGQGESNDWSDKEDELSKIQTQMQREFEDLEETYI